MRSVAAARSLSLIGAASSAGAYGPGQERAPETFRRHGLVADLQSRGRHVIDNGDVTTALFREDPGNPRAANVDTVAAVAKAVAHRVAESLAADHDVLVLGGDCTVELGTVAGAALDGSSVGLVYVDLDADLNTPDTGDGVLDWMGVAHLLDLEGCEERLTTLGARRPLLEPGSLLLMACDRATDPEQAVIDRLRLRRESLHDVSTDTEAVLDRTRAWAAGFDRLLVHVDADVLDFAAFPIAENTRRVPGLRLDTLAALLRGLCAVPSWRCLTISEINPDHADDEAAAFARLIEMIGEGLAPHGGQGTD